MVIICVATVCGNTGCKDGVCGVNMLTGVTCRECEIACSHLQL